MFLITKSKASFGKFLLVLKALFSKKVIPFYIGIGIYLALIVFSFNKLGIFTLQRLHLLVIDNRNGNVL